MQIDIHVVTNETVLLIEPMRWHWHKHCLSEIVPLRGMRNAGPLNSPMLKTKDADMLKITIRETPTELKLVLAGRLVGPWVTELRAAWKGMFSRGREQGCTIDLNDVTPIDKSGERLLCALYRKAARLIADRVYTKYLVERLKIICQPKPGMLPLLLLAGFLPQAAVFGVSGGISTQSQKAIAVQALCITWPTKIDVVSKARFPKVEGGTECPQVS